MRLGFFIKWCEAVPTGGFAFLALTISAGFAAADEQGDQSAQTISFSQEIRM